MIPSSFTSSSVQNSNSFSNGAANHANARIVPASNAATLSGYANPTRFGTNSPNTNIKDVSPSVTPVSESQPACAANSGDFAANQRESCAASFAPASTPAIIPESVSQNSTSAKNRAGCSANSSAWPAPTSPFAASFRNLVFFAETTAVSAMASTPLATTNRLRMRSSSGKLNMTSRHRKPAPPPRNPLLRALGPAITLDPARLPQVRLSHPLSLLRLSPPSRP